ncbi:MAG: hypothetical protein EBT32_01575 [Betaproteobacteria bacterium]|nr:hypothetical protein [Betaproteobacteria bacterium]
MAGDSTLVSALVPAQSLRDRQSIKLAFPPPLGLYIHMPWCEKKFSIRMLSKTWVQGIPQA